MNDFLYTNSGVSIIDNSLDYGIRKFQDYNQQNLNQDVQKNLKSLDEFLRSNIDDLHKDKNKSVILGYGDKVLKLIVLTTSFASCEIRSGSRRENYVVEGVIFHDNDWPNNDLTWQIAFELPTKNPNALMINNKAKNLFFAEKDDVLLLANELFPWKPPKSLNNEKNTPNFYLLKVLVITTLLGIFASVCLWFLPSKQIQNKDKVVNPQENNYKAEVEKKDVFTGYSVATEDLSSIENSLNKIYNNIENIDIPRLKNTKKK